ncbi:MAG: DUF3750 domain-containing protein [Planctomycetes bacterium]|nr:DUF3750 domain-containing protein [Planctomycetota bacterium]
MRAILVQRLCAQTWVVLVTLVALGAGCSAPRPHALPRDAAWIVAAKSCRLPEWMDWYTRFAHHTWLDVKRGDEGAWVRIEVEGKRTGGTLEPIPASAARADVRWRREVELHDVLVGERAERVALALDAAVARLGPRYASDYQAYPGPNSNTFIAELAREIPELELCFDHNALGKDYAGWGTLALAPSGTGVRLDTWPLGLTLAAREGLELHLAQLVFGVQLWPPRVQLPFLPELPWSASAEQHPPPQARQQLEFCGGLSGGSRPVEAQGSFSVLETDTGQWIFVEWSIEPADGGSRLDLRVASWPTAAEPATLRLPFDGERVALPKLGLDELTLELEFERRPQGELRLHYEALLAR